MSRLSIITATVFSMALAELQPEFSPAPQNAPQYIPQRELRNNSGEILRRVEAGESFVVTTRGRPVAEVIPIRRVEDAERKPDRPGYIGGRRIVSPAAANRSEIIRSITPATTGPSIQEAMDFLRAERIW